MSKNHDSQDTTGNLLALAFGWDSVELCYKQHVRTLYYLCPKTGFDLNEAKVVCALL
jgi:hypothetical protein